MKVTPSFQNINIQKAAKTLKGKLPKQIVLPEPVGAVIKRAGNYISTPEQKLFLAASTLMIAPFWDLKFAEEDKKIDTAIKTASKAIAGGITGVAIRGGFQYYTKKSLKPASDTFFNNCFYPQAIYRILNTEPELARIRLDQYGKTMGTLFAVLFMILFSNSKMDVPLTSDIQDLISGVVKDDKSWLSSLADVSKSRKGKIEDWFKQKKNKLISIKNKITAIAEIIKADDTEINKEVKKQE